MNTIKGTYEFTFPVSLTVDKSDMEIITAQLLDTLDDWIDDNTKFDSDEVPNAFKLEIFRVAANMILS